MEIGKLNSKIRSGIIWNSIQTVLNRGFGFAVKIILAKILFPEAFGLIGMATVFIAVIGALNEMGMSAALIQRSKDSIRDAHYNTAFWLGILWAIALYLIVALLIAPFAANFYHEPLLDSIIPVLGITLLFNPIISVQRAKLVREMNFKAITYINSITNIACGSLSILLAYYDFGVWALVFNTVSVSILRIPFYFLKLRWTPKFEINNQAFKDIFNFGVYATGTSVVGVALNNFDYLIIGKLVSSSALGAYTFAFILTDTVRTQIMKVVNTVMYPVYSVLQNDKKKLREYYLKVVKLNAIVIFPIMGIVLLFADKIILNFLGDEWSGAITPSRLLAASVMVHMFVNSNTTLIRGMGKAKTEFHIQSAKTILLFLPSIYLGTRYYGIDGAAGAILLNKIASVFIAQYYLKKYIAITYQMLWASLRAPISILVVSLVVSLLTIHFGLHFVLSAMIFLLTYSALTYKISYGDIMSMVNIISKKSPLLDN